MSKNVQELNILNNDNLFEFIDKLFKFSYKSLNIPDLYGRVHVDAF